MTILYLNVIVGGMLIGVVYALIALGLTIIFGVMRVVNFAHGEMVVIGMYIGYGLWSVTRLPPWMLAPVAGFCCSLSDTCCNRLIVNAFIGRPQHAQFILFISFALIITGLHLVLFGPDSRPIQIIESMQSYTIGPIRLDVVRTQAALMASVLIGALMIFLRYLHARLLDPGRRRQPGRGAGDRHSGRRVYAVTAGIGMACAGAAGALISPMFDTQPFLATDFTLIAFIIVIVGRARQPDRRIVRRSTDRPRRGHCRAGVLSRAQDAFSYALLVFVLLLRPNGLFGEPERS